MARIMDALTGARRVADIGCGAGVLSGALVKRSFDVVGISPRDDLIGAARKRMPDAVFVAARAESMPMSEADVNAAAILNALHHIPQAALDAALEALRILRPGGALVIGEPLAEGGFLEAVQPVDDETVVRPWALDALARLIAEAPERLERQNCYEIPVRFDGAEAFLEYLQEAEPARAKQIRAQRGTVLQSIADHASQDEDGFTLTAQMAIWVFRVAGSKPNPRKVSDVRLRASR